MDYNLLVLAHVLLLVYWLGGDIGVFYSSFFVVDPKLSNEARGTAAKILVWVDQLPRYCLVLILPVGLAMATKLGLITLPAPGLTLLAVGGLAWLSLVYAIHHFSGTSLAKMLGRIDMVVRLAVIAGVGGTGLLSLLGKGPIPVDWLAAKMVVYALIVAAGLSIRIVAKPFSGGFARLMQEGSSPEIEATISGALGRARPFVVFIWIGLIATSWLGIAKPTLF